MAVNFKLVKLYTRIYYNFILGKINNSIPKLNINLSGIELENRLLIIFPLDEKSFRVAAYSFRKLIEILLGEIKKKRFLVNIPFNIAKFQSYFLQMLPNPILTIDQVELLKYDNIISGEHPTLKDLGIQGKTIHSILPKHIYRFRTYGQFG